MADLTDAQKRFLQSAYTARNGKMVARQTSRTAVVARALERKGLGLRNLDYFILNDAGCAAAAALSSEASHG